MIIRFLPVFVVLIELVFGQTTTTGQSQGTATSSAAIQTWTVAVGKGDNTFVVRPPIQLIVFHHTYIDSSLRFYRQTLEILSSFNSTRATIALLEQNISILASHMRILIKANKAFSLGSVQLMLF
jgi:hypothetical protein